MFLTSALRTLFLLAFAAAISGCAFLPLESPRIPSFSSRSQPAFAVPFREAVGVIHAHSVHSDGSEPVEVIARIAEAQGLDLLILTDHNTLAGKREGQAGWHGRTLVLVDHEISTADGHYLALGLSEEIPSRREGRWTADEVRRRGGLGFVAHPTWRRRPWEDRGVRGMTGMEVYDAASDLGGENRLLLGLATLFLGSDPAFPWWLGRPAEALKLWDEWLARGERVVGIGSAEAHGLRRFGLRLAPYGPLFKLARNHLWLDGPLEEESVYEALREGRLFVAHDAVADARGFQFLAVAEQKIAAPMGGEVRWRQGIRLYGYLPSPGVMTLYRNGRPVASAAGQHGWFDAGQPGVYRLEAARKGKPWIYSNPIYVT